jgi:hypothetical protein
VGTVDGILILRKGESLVEVEIDLSDRHEIVDGQTISSDPSPSVLDADGDTTTDLTVSSVARGTGTIGTTNTSVTFEVTVNAAAVEGDEYEIKFPIVLSGGATIVECLGVTIEKC